MISCIIPVRQVDKRPLGHRAPVRGVGVRLVDELLHRARFLDLAGIELLGHRPHHVLRVPVPLPVTVRIALPDAADGREDEQDQDCLDPRQTSGFHFLPDHENAAEDRPAAPDQPLDHEK